MIVEVMFTLVFFSLEGNPSIYMRESYCDYVYIHYGREREKKLCESEEEITEDLLKVLSLHFSR